MEQLQKRTVTIGEKAYFHKTVTETDVCNYAAMTGSFNRLMIDEDFAKKSRFGRRIVHGPIVSGFLATISAMKMPGGNKFPVLQLFLDAWFRYLKPVFIGDTITAELELTGVTEKSTVYIAELTGKCTNQHNEVVVTGVLHEMLGKDSFIVKQS
jgi:3-hydroxybutyryl-CoA dehydratase